jgi:antagonist of KipI
VLPVGQFPARLFERAGIWLPPDYRPQYTSSLEIPVILGPQDADFGSDVMHLFLSGEYTVNPMSDRMGYRLSGPRLERIGQGEPLSQGIAPGSIQVPPGGQPIVLLADRPTAGGYPKIATVARVGLPLLVQAMPGAGRVRFEAVSVEDAQTRLRQLVKMVEVGIEEQNED